VGNLFTRIVDDAALFPPAREAMGTALPAYREARRDPVLGRFLCPASRFEELREHLVPEDLFELGLIADTGIEALPQAIAAARAEPRVRLGIVEIPLPAEADQARAVAVTLARLPADLPAFIEHRRTPGWMEAVQRIGAARERGVPVGAKLRTGGPTPELVPGADEVAAFLKLCVEARLPFKCTAGMHHAVRHHDPAPEHGFLNVLLATADLLQGLDRAADTVRSEDAQALAARARALPDADARAVRELFVSYGSCDIHTPSTELIKLGLIGEEPS
jgi:hypothetical protein